MSYEDKILNRCCYLRKIGLYICNGCQSFTVEWIDLADYSYTTWVWGGRPFSQEFWLGGEPTILRRSTSNLSIDSQYSCSVSDITTIVIPFLEFDIKKKIHTKQPNLLSFVLFRFKDILEKRCCLDNTQSFIELLIGIFLSLFLNVINVCIFIFVMNMHITDFDRGNSSLITRLSIFSSLLERY